MSNTPEIDVKRRRKGEKPVRQAETPVRRQQGSRPSTAGTSGDSYQPSGGGTFGSGGSGSFGSGGSKMGGSVGKLGGCGLILVVLVFAVIFFLMPGNNSGDTYIEQEPQTSFTQPTSLPATAAPRPTRPPSTGSADQTWLVMLYQDADDQALEQDIYLDLNEAEKVGSSDQVTIVAQMDRFRGGFSGTSDWHSARRYLVTQDDDLNSVNSQLLEDLGEVNMADGDTLVDFVTWSVENFPADRYALILSDHGLGWPGGWSDPAPGATDPGSAPLVRSIKGDHIFLSEMDSALAAIQSRTGISKLDLIGMDACLMSQIEVYAMLQPLAKYAVASEETEPGLGWAYASFLDTLVRNPAMDGASLAANIVESYIDQDQRIVDPQARSEFLRQGSTMGGFFGAPSISADQLANQLSRSITLTAVDLEAFPQLNTSFNNFAYAMQDIDQNIIASSRTYAQSYTSIFGNQVPPSFIDLGHFVLLVAKQSGSSAIVNAAKEVVNALNNTIISEKHGTSKPGSTGIALYFPNSTLYRSPQTGLQSYTMLTERFSRASLWDDFLVFHYNDRPFESDAAQPVAPFTSGITRAPGAGDITISAITASANSVSAGSSVRLSAEITGDSIGYAYLFTGVFDEASNSILVADSDYLESPDTADLNGVYYPVWPDNRTFKMNFEFEPLLWNITAGSQSALAMFDPVSYGASAEEAVYSVSGTYTFAQTGEQRQAKLLFRDGRLFQVFGFNGNQTAAAPSEITPAEGDTFTVSLKWLELDSSGNISQVEYEDGETLVFMGESFEWEQVYAPEGTYLVGFLVSDLDGNLKQSYTSITVR